METLKYNDKITFTVEGNVFHYRVSSDYLIAASGTNDIIFTTLGLIGTQKYTFCDKWYGYTCDRDGTWPNCKYEDYEALTRIVEALQVMCDKTCENFCILGITQGNTDEFTELLKALKIENRYTLSGGCYTYYGVKNNKVDFAGNPWSHLIFNNIEEVYNYFKLSKHSKYEVQNIKETQSGDSRGSAIRVSSRRQLITIGSRPTGNQASYEICRTRVVKSEMCGQTQHQSNLR